MRTGPAVIVASLILAIGLVGAAAISSTDRVLHTTIRGPQGVVFWRVDGPSVKICGLPTVGALNAGNHAPTCRDVGDYDQAVQKVRVQAAAIKANNPRASEFLDEPGAKPAPNGEPQKFDFSGLKEVPAQKEP